MEAHAVQQEVACNSTAMNWVMSPNTLMLCRVCQRQGCNTECDACGQAVHLQDCACSNGEYVVCVVCYTEMVQRYGEQQLVHTQFLISLLEQQRRARRAERFHRTVQVSHEVADRAEAFGAGMGALIGGAAAATSGAVRGVAEGLQATLRNRASGTEHEGADTAMEDGRPFEEASEGRGGEQQIEVEEQIESSGQQQTPQQGPQDYIHLALQQAKQLQELREQLGFQKYIQDMQVTASAFLPQGSAGGFGLQGSPPQGSAGGFGLQGSLPQGSASGFGLQ
eukprot:497480-Amphidinium_carterae.1